MPDISPDESTIRKRQRSRRLLSFYDDFAEFQSSCAFFCDAVIGILHTDTEIDRDTLEGIRAYSDQVKDAASELKEKLKLIQETDI